MIVMMLLGLPVWTMRTLPFTNHRRLLIAITVIVSALLHWFVLTDMTFNPQPAHHATQPSIAIRLDYPVPAPLPPEPEATSPVLPDPGSITPPVDTTTEEVQTSPIVNQIEPVIEQPTPTIEPFISAPKQEPVSASALKRQLLASIRQPKPTDQPTLQTELPTNWTQDALPQTGAPAKPLFEPLTYTGPTKTERWKSIDGTAQIRKVLSDGTVICARAVTLLPNSNFEASVMQGNICGKEKGGRKNQNQLARFHPNNQNNEPSEDTEEASPPND